MRICSECNKSISKGSKSGLCRSCSTKKRWTEKRGKKFKIVIPTYKRIKKLCRLIESINKNTFTNWEIIVFVDNYDTETAQSLRSMYLETTLWKKITIRINEAQIFQIGSWNKFYKEYINDNWSGAFLLCDDVELLPNCIENAIDCWVANFPDGDGIVGLTQVYPDHPEVRWCEAGQILIGKKFIERFKEVDYQVHCPNYQFFQQDLELEKFAKSLNKFKLSDTAKLIHHHPCKYPEELDETHRIPRQKIVTEDRFIAKLRKAKGLIWGKSFELINLEDK